jgi:hypothetical protein
MSWCHIQSSVVGSEQMFTVIANALLSMTQAAPWHRTREQGWSIPHKTP